MPVRVPLHIEKSRILAQLNSYRAAKPGQFRAMLGVFGVSLFSVVTAFGTAPTVQEIQGFQQTVVESLTLPTSGSTELSGETFVREERIQRGDTVGSLLARIGVEDDKAMAFLLGSADTQAIFRQLSPGKNVTGRISSTGELQQ